MLYKIALLSNCVLVAASKLCSVEKWYFKIFNESRIQIDFDVLIFKE